MQVIRSEKTVKLSALTGGSVFKWHQTYYLKLSHPIYLVQDDRAFTAITLGFDASPSAIDLDTQVTFIKGKFVEDIPK